MSLSDKIFWGDKLGTKDVKEFIKKLKKRVSDKGHVTMKFIDKLAGSKLVERGLENGKRKL